MKNALNPIYDDPVYLFDIIMETIEKTPFGDINSIINDTLRLSISKIYGINMNMFDTHSFTIVNGLPSTSTDGLTKKPYIDDTLYIYEADSKNIHHADDVESGIYKDGILLGIIETAFRESDYSSLDDDTIVRVIEQLDVIACNISFCYHNRYHWITTPYTEYIVSISHAISVIGYLLKKKCPIKHIQKFYNLDKDIYDLQGLKKLARNGINARYFYDDSIDIYSKLRNAETEKREKALITPTVKVKEDKALIENTNFDTLLIFYNSDTAPVYDSYDAVVSEVGSDNICHSHDKEENLIKCALYKVPTFCATFIPEADTISTIIVNGYSIKHIGKLN